MIGLDLVREDLDQLLAAGADPALIADQPHDAKQVALDHQRVEARRELRRVDPVEDEMVLEGTATRQALHPRPCSVHFLTLAKACSSPASGPRLEGLMTR